MSRNFTTDVDTQREYFNAQYFNNSGQNQIARYDTTLLKPFFKNPDQWKLAINRMRVPLSGIPLTKNNIPFQQWQVGIKFQRSYTDTLEINDEAYVPQFNASTSVLPASILANTQKIYTYTNNFTDLIETQNVSPSNIYNAGNLSQDTYYSQQFMCYLIGSVPNPTYLQVIGLAVYNNAGGVIQVISGSVLFGNYILEAISFDQTTGDIYVGMYGGLNDYKVRRLVNNNNLWSLAGLYDLSTFMSQTSQFTSLLANNGYIYVGHQTTGQSTSTLTILNITGGAVVQTYSFNVPVVVKASPQYIFIISAYGGSQADNITVNTFDGTSFIPFGIINLTETLNVALPFFGFDATNNLYLQTSNNQFFNVSPTGTIVQQPTTPPQQPVNMMFPTNPISVTSDAGPYDIFTYQDFLNQINAAFLKVFNDLKLSLGATFLPTEPPSIIYNAQSKLFSMSVEGQYLTTNDDGSNQYLVFMNQTLWNQFYFPSTNIVVGSNNYKSIIMQNNGINAVVGTGTATLPQFIFVQQEDVTIYAFYDLTRIIVGTTRIPVSGDGEGRTFSNTGSVSNASVNMITDIVPDTTSLTPGSVIIYIPEGILRWYNLYAQQPFDKIDLTLQYETKDGSIYPIIIPSGEFFSVKLEFKKGPGDF